MRYERGTKLVRSNVSLLSFFSSFLRFISHSMVIIVAIDIRRIENRAKVESRIELRNAIKNILIIF